MQIHYVIILIRHVVRVSDKCKAMSSFTPKHPRFVVCEKQVVFADFFQVVFAEHNFLIEASCAEKEISSDFFFLPCLVFSALGLSAPAGYTSFESTLKRWSLDSDIRKDDKEVHC